MRTHLRYAAAICLVTVLGSCGGGASNSTASVATPPDGTVTIGSNVHIWGPDQIAAIKSEDPGQISAAGAAAAVGDIILTQKTALKVGSVGAADSSGNVQLTGTTPALEEVAPTLQIHVAAYPLTVNQFSPAAGVSLLTGSADTLSATRSASSTSTQISLTLDSQLATGLHGKIAVTFSPTFDFDFSSAGPTGTATLRGAFSAQPELTISDQIGEWTQIIPLGSWSVPLVIPPLPPGLLAVKIPLTLNITAVAGKVNFTVSATGTANLGAQLTVSPTDADMEMIGDGISFTQDDQFFSFALGATGSLDVRLGTGISLSTMFGLSQPLAGLLSAGVKGELTYAAMPQAIGAPLDLTCLSGKIDAVQDFSVRVAMFGLTRTKATQGTTVNLQTWAPSARCSSINLTVPLNVTPGSAVDLATVLSDYASLETPPTGTVTFKLAGPSGQALCTNVPIDPASGSSTCSALVPGTGTIAVEADYSGDSVYAAASAMADIQEISPNLDVTIASAACTLPGTTLNNGIATYAVNGTAAGTVGESFAIEAWGTPEPTAQFNQTLTSGGCGGWSQSNLGAPASAMVCTRLQGQPAATSWSVVTQVEAFSPMYFFAYSIDEREISATFGPLDSCPAPR